MSKKVPISMRIVIFINILFLSFSLFAEEKLIFAIDLIRHGDRTPTQPLPKMQYPWQEGAGQLITKGVEKAYQLGENLRKEYVEEQQLLSLTYQQPEIYIRSTSYDRTIMTAQAVLMGLYPTGARTFSSGYLPIPVHARVKEHDELLPYHLLYEKPKDKLFNKFVYQQKTWQEKIAKLPSQYPKLSKITGLEIKEAREISHISDTLYVMQNENVPFPEELTKEEINHIISIGDWAFAHSFKPKEVGATLGGELFTTVATYLIEADQKKSPLKYVLLSGHDCSLLSILSAMRAPLNESPHYLSRLNFSLFENNGNNKNSDNNQFVKISYNNEPIYIPRCGGTSCTIAQIKEIMQEAKNNTDKATMNDFRAEMGKKMEAAA